MTFKARHAVKALLILVAVAVLGGLVMVLWNAVVPDVFGGARAIDYPHALGLLVLSRILFGGFRGRGGWHGHHRWGRWQAMTAEEREQFRHNLHAGRRRDAEDNA
jgi:hypothetical protein